MEYIYEKFLIKNSYCNAFYKTTHSHTHLLYFDKRGG